MKTANLWFIALAVIITALVAKGWSDSRLQAERNRMEQQTVDQVKAFTEKTKKLIVQTKVESDSLRKVAEKYRRAMNLYKTRADSAGKALAAILESLPDTTPAACQPYADAITLCQQEAANLRSSLEQADSIRVTDSVNLGTLSSTLTQATVTIASQDSTIRGLEKHLRPKKFLGILALPKSLRDLFIFGGGFLLGHTVIK